jgi:hypothetical protein
MSTSRAQTILALLIVTAVMTVAAQTPGGVAAKPGAAQRVTEASAAAQAAAQPAATPPAKPALKPGGKAAAKGALLGQLRRQSFERARVLAGTTGAVTLPPDLRNQCVAVMDQHRSDAAQSATPGFGTMAGKTGPFVEEKFADGVVVYRFSGGSAVAPPNVAPYYCAYMVARMEVPKALPPAIPSDDSQQAKWARYHNAQLQDVIGRLVHYDDATLQKIEQAALAATNGDLFKTTDFLTGVADFYAGNVP